MHPIFKPKTKEELGEAYHKMKKQTYELMTLIFSDLGKDPNNRNVYVNSKCEWVFFHDLKYNYIYVNYYIVWLYFLENITNKDNIIKMLIENWLRENTNWPQLQVRI